MANIETAIDATRRFRDEVAELQAELDSLPLERTVTIRYNTEGAPEAFASGLAGTSGFQDQANAVQDTADVFRSFDDILAEYEQMQSQAGDAAARSGAEAAASAAGVEAQADAIRSATAASKEAAFSQSALALTMAGMLPAACTTAAAG